MRFKYCLIPLAILAKLFYDTNEWREIEGPYIRPGNGRAVDEGGEGVPCVTTPFRYPSIGDGGFEDIDVVNRVAFSGVDDRRAHDLFNKNLLPTTKSGAIVYMREGDSTWHVLPTNHPGNYDKSQRMHPYVV
jgi:hypothetical protein